MGSHKWNKKWLICLSSFIAIIIPFIINEAYKYGEITGKGYVTAWTASDVLSFYGTLLGAVATIIVLIITIKHNQKLLQISKKEQRIRENFQREKEIADDIINIILLTKYNDDTFQNNNSIYLLSQDLNFVLFEASSRISNEKIHISNKDKFYIIVYNTHNYYALETSKLYENVDQTRGDPLQIQNRFNECKKNIVHKKHEVQEDLRRALKGLYFQLNEEMNSQIDKLYEIQEEI